MRSKLVGVERGEGRPEVNQHHTVTNVMSTFSEKNKGSRVPNDVEEEIFVTKYAIAWSRARE